MLFYICVIFDYHVIVWFSGHSFDQSSETWRSLARVASLCNRATFKPDQEGVPIPKVQVYGFKACGVTLSQQNATSTLCYLFVLRSRFPPFLYYYEKIFVPFVSLLSHFYHFTQRIVVGDASETALLKFTELTVGNIMDYRNRFKKVVEVPFNSTNKFQVRAGSCVVNRLLIILDQIPHCKP